MDPNELKLKIFHYLDEGYLVEEIPEILDISLEEVKEVIRAAES